MKLVDRLRAVLALTADRSGHPRFVPVDVEDVRATIARIEELHAERDALRSEVERLRAESAWVPCMYDTNEQIASIQWPDPGDRVLVTCWPWRDGAPRYVTVAGFLWEGENGWRPTFRDSDGEKVKPSPMAWLRLPAPYQEEAPDVPS